MKNFARIIGPLLILVGLLLIVSGFSNIFASAGQFDFGPPQTFVEAFIGMPLLVIGVGITKYAYLKPISNYLAGETQDAFSTVASGIGKGLGYKPAQSRQAAITCRQCNGANRLDAKFCNECGTALNQPVICGACGEHNDPDARFCDHCGSAMAEPAR